MKNLLNCHTLGVHSFPISFENGLYRRIFYAEEHHNLWKPIEVAIHPHHVDIKITVLEGSLYNMLYAVDKNGSLFSKFKWNSHILNGMGGFEYLGEDRLCRINVVECAENDVIIMQACELHTIQILKGVKAVWLVEETIPTCEYFPINYSINDLTKWTPEGLYMEVSDDIKQSYIGKYLVNL